MIKYADVLRKIAESQTSNWSGTITAQQRLNAPPGYFYDPSTGHYHDVDRPDSPGFETAKDAKSFERARQDGLRTGKGYTWQSTAPTLADTLVEQQQPAMQGSPNSQVQPQNNNMGQSVPPASYPRQQPQRKPDMNIKTFSGFR